MRILQPAFLAIILAIPPLVYLTLRAAGRLSSSGLSIARGRAFLALRISAIVLLALGLAGIGLARMTDRIGVLFLLDESESIDSEGYSRALGLVEKVRARLSPRDEASIVRFGATAAFSAIDSSASRSASARAGLDPAARGEGIDTSATDISQALQLGLAQAGGAQRIVLLSDGNENRGSAEEAVAVARALGARIFSFPIVPSAAGAEVTLDDIDAPARVRAGEPHEVRVLARSRAQAQARVSLFRDGTPMGQKIEVLQPGLTSIAFAGLLPDRGLHSYEALVESASDGLLENNIFRVFVEVTGNPQILYVTKPGQQSSALLSALTAQGIDVVVRESSALPSTLAGFLPFDAVILDNAPGYGISYEKMETIEQYVRDTGGGLLMIGGESSFGAGGYYKTPIERALPVDMDVKSQVQMPRLTLIIVADKSGSMGGTVATGETKLEVVKSAAFSAIELLSDFDRAGLLAFDANFEWTVPLTEAGNREQVANELTTLTSGGGTILYPALEEAYRVIAQSQSPLRHIIVLSDGLTNPGEFEALVGKMARDKITISTVAVGEDADKDLLARIAKWGGGRYYATSDPRNVPRIFMTETILVSRGLLIEKRFLPAPGSGSEILKGVSMAAVPPLDGFVLTYAKDGAEKVLSALYDAPLLATWRYGLGKTAAFTSDFRGRWGKSWLAWDQFSRFVAQLVRWIERPSPDEILHPRLTVRGGQGSVVVDAYDGLGAFVNGLEIRGIVLGPAREREEMEVAQTGPGLYSGRFRAERVGDYTITLSARSGESLL